MKRFCPLLFLVLVSALSANAIDFTISNIKYSEYRQGKSVYCIGLDSEASNNSNFTSVNIPGWVSYNGVTYNVEGIDVTAFYQERYIQYLKVQYGVKKIMASAFKDCTSLKSVTLSSSITDIGSGAFKNCALNYLNLAWLTMPNVASDAFEDAGNIGWKVYAPTYPAMNLIKGLTALKNEYPSYVVSATLACDVTMNSLPYIVTKAATSSSRGEMALVGPISYSGDLTLGGVIELGDYGLTNQSYYGSTIADSAFVGNTGITSVTIPSSYKTVGYGAFRGATKLATVNVSAKLIKNMAFNSCSALTTLNLNEGVDELEPYALYLDRNITTFNISKTVRNVGDSNYNLLYLEKLQKFTVDSDNPYYSTDSYGALYNKAKTVYYRCPPNRTNAGIANTVTELRYGAFSNFKGTMVVIPYGTVKTSNMLFADCPNLKFVKIPSTLTTFSGVGLFVRCPNLEEVVMGAITPPIVNVEYMFGFDNNNNAPCAPPTYLNFKVPLRSLNTYRNDSRWNALATYISDGGYDIIMNVNSDNKYYLCLDSETKEAFVTYANDVTRSYRTVLTKGVVEIAPTYTRSDGTYTIKGIDYHAFYGATELHELLIPKTSKNYNGVFFGNNASDFRCYVPNEEAVSYGTLFYGWGVSDVNNILYTYLRNDEATSQTYSPLVYPMTVPAEPAFYTVEDYDVASRVLTTYKLPESQAVKAGSGLLVTGMEKGKIYRIDKPSVGYEAVSLLEGIGWDIKLLDTDDDKQYYYDGACFQALQNQRELKGYLNAHPGEAILNLPRVNVDDIDTFYVDFNHTTKGDVNGDGVVSGADVTALYGVLLDNNTVNGDADVNSDGIVNGSDVTALYTILLSD